MLPSCNCLARFGVFVVPAPGNLRPRIVKSENLRSKGRSRWVLSKRIVNPNEKLLFGKRIGPAGGAVIVQVACYFIAGLCREDLRFEIDDLLNLIRRGNRPLRVAGCCIRGLLREVVVDWLERAVSILKRFAPVPHDCAQVGDVCRGKRTAVSRNGARAGASVRIVIVENGELSSPG